MEHIPGIFFRGKASCRIIAGIHLVKDTHTQTCRDTNTHLITYHTHKCKHVYIHLLKLSISVELEECDVRASCWVVLPSFSFSPMLFMDMVLSENFLKLIIKDKQPHTPPPFCPLSGVIFKKGNFLPCHI